MPYTAAEERKHTKRRFEGMDPETPSIASPNPAPDDSQRDVDTFPFSDKQHTATPTIMNMPDIEVNDGFGDLGQPEGSPIGKNDERESNAARRAIYGMKRNEGGKH